MRDPKRIDKFCTALAKIWKRVPDWRFGQFIINALTMYNVSHHTDWFYMEDDELMEFLNNYFIEEYTDVENGR